MRILAPGSRDLAPTLVASRTALPPEGAECRGSEPAGAGLDGTKSGCVSQSCGLQGLRLRPGKAGSAGNPAPTLPTACGSLPPEGVLRLRPGKAGSAAPAGECGGAAVQSPGPKIGTCVSLLSAPGRRALGFTLLELLVVISIIAIGSAGVVFAMRDSAQTALEREGDRLVALLEAGRALSRTSGQVMRWRDTPEGFLFQGANADKLPSGWQSPQSAVQWDAGPNPHILTLGPEPIIEAQGFTLMNEGRGLRIATDGLRPFAVLPPAP
jgi:general secretion pathway protein H